MIDIIPDLIRLKNKKDNGEIIENMVSVLSLRIFICNLTKIPNASYGRLDDLIEYKYFIWDVIEGESRVVLDKRPDSFLEKTRFSVDIELYRKGRWQASEITRESENRLTERVLLLLSIEINNILDGKYTYCSNKCECGLCGG